MSDPSSGYHGADPTVLQNEGVQLAHLAVQHDQAQHFDLAIFYYTVSILCTVSHVLSQHFVPAIFCCTVSILCTVSHV